MTSYSEIFDKEARGMTESLLGSKDKLCVGAWNVCTMYEALKTAQVTNEMQKYNRGIRRISECR
jgi:hypothetical protein